MFTQDTECKIIYGEQACACGPANCCDGKNGGCGCFPSAAKVSLENGKSLVMSELQVGDRVQAGMESVAASKIWVTSVIIVQIQWVDRE